MIVVVATMRGKLAEALVTQLLPRPIAIVTAQRCYHFFDVAGEAAEPFVFTDLDGEVLTEYQTFPTLEAAKAWVTDDAEQREHRAERAR